jgi:4-hydroxybenzoate polyprenyltransferase
MTDPVRERRARVAKWTALAKRTGYLLLLSAIAVFGWGVVKGGFTQTKVTVIVVLMFVSAVLLAPSIVLGYGIKAAERDDRQRGL